MLHYCPAEPLEACLRTRRFTAPDLEVRLPLRHGPVKTLEVRLQTKNGRLQTEKNRLQHLEAHLQTVEARLLPVEVSLKTGNGCPQVPHYQHFTRKPRSIPIRPCLHGDQTGSDRRRKRV